MEGITRQGGNIHIPVENAAAHRERIESFLRKNGLQNRVSVQGSDVVIIEGNVPEEILEKAKTFMERMRK